MTTINIKILDDRLKDVPMYATGGAAAVDLKPMISRPVILAPNETVLLSTGFALQIPSREIAAVILPRSGKGHTGLVLGNLAGLIDSDYNKEVFMSVWNRSDEDFIIEPDTYIAQMIFIPVIKVHLNPVREFESPTNRGGFGSTVK
jgi:dUTP pyrophosphatase